MKYFIAVVAAVGSLLATAQENSSSALNLTLTDYLANTTSGTGCTAIPGSLGASGSGVPTCSAAP